jgi:hypothetical protein
MDLMLRGYFSVDQPTERSSQICARNIGAKSVPFLCGIGGYGRLLDDVVGVCTDFPPPTVFAILRSVFSNAVLGTARPMIHV